MVLPRCESGRCAATPAGASCSRTELLSDRAALGQSCSRTELLSNSRHELLTDRAAHGQSCSRAAHGQSCSRAELLSDRPVGPLRAVYRTCPCSAARNGHIVRGQRQMRTVSVPVRPAGRSHLAGLEPVSWRDAVAPPCPGTETDAHSFSACVPPTDGIPGPRGDQERTAAMESGPRPGSGLRMSPR